MGANAQTSVPTFTAGEVLTAANMNISARTGIPVFADATARDAAFGGTGEKTLAEGQFAFLEDTNATQFYDGAAWQSVGASGLTLIKAQTIGSAVASVTVTGAFSSTYDTYLITVSGGAGSTQTDLKMTLGATTSDYAMSTIYSVFTNTVSVAGSSAQASWLYAGTVNTTSLFMNTMLQNPFLTEQTFIESFFTGSTIGGISGGFLNNTTSYTAFTIAPVTGTITGGTIRVYGYANS